MMQHAIADITFDQHQAVVTGTLDFSNVTTIYEKSLQFLQDNNAVTFDFEQLTATNSAGLALLIEWVKFAKANKKKIKFINLDKHLLAIAKLGSVDALLQSV